LNSEPTTSIGLAAAPEEFRDLLLAWFDQQGRSLPWRRDRSLYGTWISEMMLQQTTVKVVEPYWLRFMARFPDVKTLAAAAEEEVLAMWSGLGYYRRARHLHAAAVMVRDELGGRLPTDRSGWQDLPGVGPYAAGAITSIGLGLPEPAIDANARRVLARWLLSDPAAFPLLKPALFEREGRALVDPYRPGDWSEALMELGALVCVAGQPKCGACPVKDLCRAGRSGMAGRIPPPKRKTAAVPTETALLVVRWGDRVLLLPPGWPAVAVDASGRPPVREDVSGLHQGLWGLPAGPWVPPAARDEAGISPQSWCGFLADLQKALGIKGIPEPEELGVFQHAITRYRLRVRVFAVRLEAATVGPGKDQAGFGALQHVGHDLPGLPGAPVGGVDHPCFCPRRNPDRPVSHLVTKGLSLLGAHGV
jgi:A/G-specific adenine glycosylase